MRTRDFDRTVRRAGAALVASIGLAALGLAALGLTPAAHADGSELEGSELEFGPDEDDEDDEGGENPLGLDGRDDDRGREAGADAPGPYPRAVVPRPLVLPRGVVETRLETQLGVRELVATGNPSDDAFRASGALGVDVGVMDELQVGIRYGAGSVGEDGVVPGRAASLSARYEIFDALSAEVALPLHFDPFAAGLTLGAPVKLVLGDELALMAGHDLVTFRLRRFQPRVGEAAENHRLVDEDEINTVLPSGEYALRAAALYQSTPDLALGAELASRALDFQTRNAIVSAFAILRYAPTDDIDLGLRAGAFHLGAPSRNFGGSAFASVRM